MGILYLIIAIVFEVFATSMLKFSDGFDNKLFMTLSILGYAISFYILSIVLKTMPIGIAYAIWSGFGIIAITDQNRKTIPLVISRFTSNENGQVWKEMFQFFMVIFTFARKIYLLEILSELTE